MVVVHEQLTLSLIQWLHTVKNLDLLCLGMMVTQQVLSNKLLAVTKVNNNVQTQAEPPGVDFTVSESQTG